jgi:protoporphyrinogen/coproporphyrinogen III oxidase
MRHPHDQPDLQDPCLAYDTIVVGGGVSGLTTAWRLQQGGQRVLLVEASDRVGGAIATTRLDGYLLEHGPFNVLVRSEAFAELLADLGDRLNVVHADPGSSRNRYVLLDGRLRRTPSGPSDMLFNSLLSPRERWRMMRGLVWSKPCFDERESLDGAARRRLGDGAADKLISALSVGVYGGESTDIEFASCVPKVSRIERGVRSPLLAMMRARRNGKRADCRGVAASVSDKSSERTERIRGMVSFGEGLQALPRALAGELGSSVWTDAPVTSIARERDGSWSVTVSCDSKTRTIAARNLVLATGHKSTTRLLRSVDSGLADTVGNVAGSSMVVVNLGFRREQVEHSLSGYGLLAAGSERSCPYLGVLFASSIFPHHAPDGRCVMRVFRGGTRQPDAVNKTDDENVTEVMDSLRGTLGITGEPDLVHICRWPNAIPLYAPGHGEQMRCAREKAERLDGLCLAGNYTDGVSIGGCVERGDRIAREILSMPTLERADVSGEQHQAAQPKMMVMER